MRLRLSIAPLLAAVALTTPVALAAPPKTDAPRAPAKGEPPKGDPGKGGSKHVPSLGGPKVDPSNESSSDEARAQATKLLAKQAEARMAELVKRGKEACERGDLDDGIGTLSAAWSQKNDIDVAAILGACEAQAGHWPSAAEHLAVVLRVKEDSPERKKLEEMFVDARKRVGAVKVTVNVEGADIIVGDRLVGQSPLPGEVYVDAGKSVVIVAKKPGYEEIDKRVQVAAKATAQVSFELSQSRVTTNRYAGASRSRVPMIILGGAALIAGGVGASFYAAAFSKASAADDLLAEIKKSSGAANACSPAQSGCTTVKDLRTSRDSMMNIGTGVLAGSGVLLGAAALAGAWAFSGSTSASAATTPPSRAASLTVAPVVSPDGGGIWLRGAF